MQTQHPEEVVNALQHAFRHWESLHKNKTNPPHEPGLCIALTREAGTGVDVVARAIGQRLGWPVFDHELVDLIGREMGKDSRLLDRVDEKEIGWFLEAMEQLMAVPVVDEETYFYHLEKVVVGLGAYGECVIVGRGAGYLLPTDRTLRVRLVAPLAGRIQTIARKRGVSEKEAAKEIRRIDRDRADFLSRHFMRDAADLGNYDLILNVSRLNAEECANIVHAAVLARQPHAARV